MVEIYPFDRKGYGAPCFNALYNPPSIGRFIPEFQTSPNRKTKVSVKRRLPKMQRTRVKNQWTVIRNLVPYGACILLR